MYGTGRSGSGPTVEGAAAAVLLGLAVVSLWLWVASGVSQGWRFTAYRPNLAAGLLLAPGRGGLRLPVGTPGARLIFVVTLTVVAGGTLAVAGLGHRCWRRWRRPVRRGPLGTAELASGRELRGLRPRPRARVPRGDRALAPGPDRVHLGRHRRWPLLSDPEDHILVLGPTGTGKSSGYAIPAILEWPGPVVVTDPKGELVAMTLAHRRRLGPAAVFAPLMRPTDRWNPVDGIGAADDALRTAGMLMGRAPDRDPFWHELARQLLHGMLLDAACTGATLGELLHLLQGTPAEDLPDQLVDPAARHLAQGALSGGDRTAMGVVATLIAQLGPYGADQVVDATACSDFDPGGLADGSLATLYCAVTPHDAPLVRGLVSAALARAWRACYAAPPSPPALFVLDEFAQLTQLPELPALVQLGRSQGVRLLLLAQDLASIRATYGPEVSAALWSNCRAKLLLAGISEVELLEQASRLVGTTTFHGPGPEGRRGQPVTSRPLLHPDDIRRLPERRALLLHGQRQAAVIRQRRWYQERRLRARVALPRPEAASLRPGVGRPLLRPVGPRGLAAVDADRRSA